MRSADGRLCFSMARACSNSSRLRASTDCNVTPKARAPAWTSLKEDFWSGFAGFQRKATRDIFGTASFRRSSRLAARPGPRTVKPVTFPPGCARLETRPLLTGSPAPAITMGIVVIACLAARVSGVPRVTITFHLSERVPTPDPRDAHFALESFAPQAQCSFPPRNRGREDLAGEAPKASRPERAARSVGLSSTAAPRQPAAQA